MRSGALRSRDFVDGRLEQHTGVRRVVGFHDDPARVVGGDGRLRALWMIATGQCADVASAAAVDPTRPGWKWWKPTAPTQTIAAGPRCPDQRFDRTILVDFHFDLDGLVGGFDRRHRFARRGLADGELARGMSCAARLQGSTA